MQNTGTALSSLNVVPYHHISNGKCQDVPLNKIHVTPSVVSNKKDLAMVGVKYLRGRFFFKEYIVELCAKIFDISHGQQIWRTNIWDFC